jgi:hypothetical protein
MTPAGLIALGFTLLLFGFCAIFAMVIQLIAPSFALSFLGYAASFAGLLLGLVGVAQHSRKERG